MATSATASITAAVSSIIAAFVSVRDALTRSTGSEQSKARKGAQRKPKQKAGKPISSQRLSLGAGRLDKAVGEAPQAIQHEYARGLVSHGQLFEAGDVEAHAKLTTVLVKLNSGLVEVIAHLLRHPADRGRPSPGLDYHQVALLCDASRLEACQSLASLRRRLSLTVSPPLPRSPSGSAPRPSKATLTDQPSPARGAKPAGSNSPKPRSSNQVQFAFVRTRPRPGRKSSSTSSTGSSTLVGSPSPSPSSPKLSSAPRSPKEISSVGSKPNFNLVRPDADTKSKAVSSRKRTGPAIHHDKSHKSSPHHDSKTIAIETANEPMWSRSQTMVAAAAAAGTQQQQRQALGVSRRQTVKSIASGSTRLGEIPMHKWPVEHDWDQMSMLNAQAAAMVAPITIIEGRARRGLFAKIFRKPAVAQAQTRQQSRM